MKLSSLLLKKRPLDRSTAWVCVLVNQCVTPGLGSLITGRLWTGLWQLLFAGAGFVLIMMWFFHLFKILYQQGDPATELGPHAWMWKRGLWLFGIGWLLALISSVGIVRQAGKTERPPRLRR